MSRGFFTALNDALPTVARQQLVQGIVGSPFFGPSALGAEFVGTMGFSIVFRRRALPTVLAKFPYLEALFGIALFNPCNAFYVNPLVLYGASRVDAHIDCRLIAASDTRIIPNLISVYYAEVAADMVGGRLVLNPGTEWEATIAPKQGGIVHFVGSTIHRVEAVEQSCRRISVVCEQYNLDQELLEEFPVCQVLTAASDPSRLNALPSTSASATKISERGGANSRYND
jgi:hypothetical protein